jgi:hypothetical protein
VVRVQRSPPKGDYLRCRSQDVRVPRSWERILEVERDEVTVRNDALVCSCETLRVMTSRMAAFASSGSNWGGGLSADRIHFRRVKRHEKYTLVHRAVNSAGIGVAQ